MPVVTQYVVVRDGEEIMTFNSKAEADAHDKMLDMVDELLPLLKRSELIDDEKTLEDLAVFLAREREQVAIALGAKRPAKKKPSKPVNKKATEDPSAA